MEKNELVVIEQREVLGNDFKIYGTKENPLFLAKDVAEWINYSISNVSKLVDMVDEEEKVRNIVTTLGGKQEAWFLTEDGLYEVLMQSKKPIAKSFKKEVKKKIAFSDYPEFGNKGVVDSETGEIVEWVQVEESTSYSFKLN